MSASRWPEILGQLSSSSDLTHDQASWALDAIMRGEVTGTEFGAFTVALRTKGETALEVQAFVEQMLSHAVPVKVDGPTLDVVGTGGDMAHTVNISTMTAIVAAACGARVVKHGNRASTSKCGSADLLTELGLSLEQTPKLVAASVHEVGIGFCFAPVFHPAMRHAGPLRKELGVPTVFNILGPLSNPARPKAMLVGAANATLAPVMAHVLADRRTSSLVVRGNDGLDEVTVFDDTTVWDVIGRSEPAESSISLSGVGLAPATPGALAGGDASFNAQVVTELFDGKTDGNLAAIRDAVALNTAAALVAWNGIDEPATDEPITARVRNHMDAAYEAIDSGNARSLLARWIEFVDSKAG